MIVKLLTEHHLEFLSLKGGCRGSSESSLVKMSKLLEISCRGSCICLQKEKRTIFAWCDLINCNNIFCRCVQQKQSTPSAMDDRALSC